MRQRALIVIAVLVLSSLYWTRSHAEGESSVVQQNQPVVIAHRGASGYVPEHTLVGAAIGFAMGADFIEPDVVLTKDGTTVVLHDIYLETVSNVRNVFPDRARADGRYYAIDFTLEEIKRLNVVPRIDPRTGKRVYPNRFPSGRGDFKVPTLAEFIELVQGLNHSMGRNVGVYPEIKQPAWHLQQGQDITKSVLTVLSRHNYRDRNANCFLQCFDFNELKRLRKELACDLKLIWLLDEQSWRDQAGELDLTLMQESLAEAAEYVDGIGPPLRLLVNVGPDGQPTPNTIVAQAHELGLLVHPYTFRRDALPDFAGDFESLVEMFAFDMRVDGLFTDFPDVTRAILEGGN